jgi:dTDP-4-dehydrorhamnose 3,5-epimerase
LKQRRNLTLNQCFIIEAPVHEDERGSFREWYWPDEFPHRIEQGNVSSSVRDVIRGMHLNVNQPGQAKWVTCFSGEINDVIVDVRPNSPTFLKHEVVNLNSTSGQILSIPFGIAHGFVSLQDNTVVSYLVSSRYDPVNEVAINPLDQELGIDWGVLNPIISTKDRSAQSLSHFLERHSHALRKF